jgi:hypothetical protein
MDRPDCRQEGQDEWGKKMTRRLSATGSVLINVCLEPPAAVLSFPGKLPGYCGLSATDGQRIDAEYDGQVAGNGQHSGNIVIRLAEEMIAGETGNHYGNQQEYRYYGVTHVRICLFSGVREYFVFHNFIF